MKFMAEGTYDGQPVQIPIEIPDSVPDDQRAGYVQAFIESHHGSDGSSLSHEDRVKMLQAGPLPGEGGGAPGFLETLGHEALGGVEEMGQGAAQITSHPDEAALGIAGGGLRLLNAPFNATGAGLGKATLEATGSPALATVADVSGQLGSAAAGAKVAGAATRAIAPRLPGAQDALLEQGLSDVKGMTDDLLTGRPSSSQLYGVVDQMNPQVASLPTLERAAKDLASNEETMSKFGVESRAIISTAKQIDETIKQGGGVSFQDARSILRRLGQRIDDLRDPLRRSTGSGEELSAMKHLYAGLLDDLETRTPKAARALTAANGAARREFATGELNDVIDKGVKAVQGKGDQSINFGTMLNNLKKEVRQNELFADAFAPGELEKIQDTLAELSKLPVTTAARGANFGSGRNLERGSIGSLVGGAVGAYTGAGAGTGALIGGATSIVSSKAIASALSTDTGRQFLLSMVRRDPNLLFSPRGAALLSAASRAGQAQADNPTDVASVLSPSEAGAADIPPEEIQRRMALMGDLSSDASGISAPPMPTPTISRDDRLRELMRQAVDQRNIPEIKRLRDLMTRSIAQ